VTAERVVAEYARIAFANVCDLFDWGRDGLPHFKAGAETQNFAALRDIRVRIDKHGTVRMLIKMQPKLQALAALARYLGIGTKQAKQERYAAAMKAEKAAADELAERFRAVLEQATGTRLG